MVENIIFVEDKDVSYIKVLSNWTMNNDIQCHCFSVANQLIDRIEDFINNKTLFIVDYFLPNIQGNDLIKYLISNSINPENIILTSIVEGPLDYFKEYFGILGIIHKTNPKNFLNDVLYYIKYINLQNLKTQIFLGKDSIVNLEYGYIISRRNDAFIKLTKKEIEFFGYFIAVSVGAVIGKFLEVNISNSTIWRLNKKLAILGFKVFKNGDNYILLDSNS